jgi:hypothetical protein
VRTTGACGNQLTDGTNSYTFSVENRVTSLSAAPYAPVTLGYDPLGRWTKGATYLWLGWDGDDMVIEKVNAAAMKWVHGADGEPLIREDTDGTWHWMYADERGSTIASALNSGVNDWVTTYDEYGRTGPGHGAYRHGYAGQVSIGSGLSFARNRVYSLNLGRFLQRTRSGCGAGMNIPLSGYPINWTDPGWRDAGRGSAGTSGPPYSYLVIFLDFGLELWNISRTSAWGSIWRRVRGTAVARGRRGAAYGTTRVAARSW